MGGKGSTASKEIPGNTQLPTGGDDDNLRGILIELSTCPSGAYLILAPHARTSLNRFASARRGCRRVNVKGVATNRKLSCRLGR